MSEEDVLFGFRLRLFTLAEELGNVSGNLPGDGGGAVDLRLEAEARALRA